MLGDSVQRGAELILGPAGSGKTTVLCARFVALARAGEQGMLMLVHSRRAARAVRERILRALGTSSDQVRVLTWHAFALSLVAEHHRALGYEREPGLLTAPEQFTLVRDLLAAPEEQGQWREFRDHLGLKGFVEELREFVLRAQDALESPESLEERARLARRPDLAEAARFFRRYLDMLDSLHLVDHANVLALAVRLLQEHADIAARVRDETRHLFADDYQDVTPAQEALWRELFSEGGSVAVAANPDARVFAFRGSSEGALDRYRRDFRPVHEVVLTETHRGRPAPEAWLFEHLEEEADAIARECRRLHSRDGTPWGEIAVVVRRDGPAARAIRRSLERGGVPYVVVGENRPLASEPTLVPMLELARAALRDDEREERLPRLLTSPVVELDEYEVRALRREARLQRSTLAALVASPPEHLPQRLRDALLDLHHLLEEVAERDRTEERADGVFWFLWQRLDHFREMVARGDEAELDAVAAFARAIERFSDRRPGHGFGDYLRALEGVEFGPEPWNVPEERRPAAVRILTAHQAVGFEFDAVFVAGCTEGEFPDPREERALLDIRDLLAPASPVERRVARLAEEKRLFGVAVSRARRRLVVTCARESSQRERLVPTPFLPMLGVEWRMPAVDTEPLTRDEAEALWRRRARDATLPDAVRLEAVANLARLPGVDPDSWWFEREWTDPGIPIAPEELRTSYSRLNAYDNCALQYLYEVELGLAPDTSHQMLVGQWVHDIIDRCQRGELGAREDELFAALHAVWDPTVFESVAIEHRRRLDAEEMLRRWLDKDAKLETLATEVAFEFPIDGAVMRGRIDRVVRFARSMVRLIDYKTGRSAKTNEEAREDLQLATYYLALKRVPELASLGAPKHLELVYLGAFTRDGGFLRAGVDPTQDPEYEQKAQARLEAFVAGIKSERFAPTPSANCQWCRFKTLCPVWPQGDEVTV